QVLQVCVRILSTENVGGEQVAVETPDPSESLGLVRASVRRGGQPEQRPATFAGAATHPGEDLRVGGGGGGVCFVDDHDRSVSKPPVAVGLLQRQQLVVGGDDQVDPALHGCGVVRTPQPTQGQPRS